MWKKFIPYALLVPQIILGIIFIAGLATGITQSLGVIPAFGLTEPTFKYYKEILSRPDIVKSITYSLYIAFTSAALAVLIGVGMCAVLVMTTDTKGKGMRIIQLPIIVPHVVVALFVVNILSQNGLLARLLCAMGFIKEQQDFVQLLYSTNGVGVIIAYLWKEIPFVIYFVIALMTNINGSLGEAAINLGASRMKAFMKVTLPLCRRAIGSSFLIIFTFALGAYELPLLLGPTSPEALPILAHTQYIHPDLENRPYAMALNGIIIIISMICAVAYFRLMQKNTEILNRRKAKKEHNEKK